MSAATALGLAVALTVFVFIIAAIAVKRKLKRHSTYMESPAPSRMKDCYEICSEDAKGEDCGEICSFGRPKAKTPTSASGVDLNPVNTKDSDR